MAGPNVRPCLCSAARKYSGRDDYAKGQARVYCSRKSAQESMTMQKHKPVCIAQESTVEGMTAKAQARVYCSDEIKCTMNLSLSRTRLLSLSFWQT